MGYKSTAECVNDLEKHGHLIKIKEETDPYLEMAEIQRRVYEADGPAIYFERVKGSPFPAVSNLFGSLARARYIFRDTLDPVKELVALKGDPSVAVRNPSKWGAISKTLYHSWPKRVFTGPVLSQQTTIDQLPQIQSWPGDGGAFITLPQVYTEHPESPGIMKSNLGMYRIQLAGNRYELNHEVGLHYQIHRGIGTHHAAALRRGEPLKVTIFIGGPPANTFAAVMPLPEGLPEVAFAGALNGRRFRYLRRKGYTIAADADFCITGTVMPGDLLPEGPFGDHLGYYSMKHDFPVLKIDKVYHKRDAVWPFTVVGRPPQEDTVFGQLVHDITGPVIPETIAGLKAVHAVDAAGVHPLLLAIGSERYVPYENDRQPREILTIANAILGFGQLSLAKYLFITAQEDNPGLNIHEIDEYLMHVFERVDWKRDLHFQTNTTIDTLDYSGTGLNEGSKVIIAAAGRKRRTLVQKLPLNLKLPNDFNDPKLVMPGVITIKGPKFEETKTGYQAMEQLNAWLDTNKGVGGIAMIVVVDDSKFVSHNLKNFLWVTFTRSNPSHDIYGVDSFFSHKHWGCGGPLIIDARIKPHHAPPLIENPEITKRVDALGARGGSLHGII